MKKTFSHSVHRLREIANRFDPASSIEKAHLIEQISTLDLPVNSHLSNYHDALLFLKAYPDSETLINLVELELLRIGKQYKKLTKTGKDAFENTGLPYTNIVTRFTPDFLSWLMQQKDLSVEFDSFYHSKLTLNDVLFHTLPGLLKSETTAGLSNQELLKHLMVGKDRYLPFLLDQIKTFEDSPFLKDFLMEQISVYVRLKPNNLLFSKTFNRIPVKSLYYHDALLKTIDPLDWLKLSLPAPTRLSRDLKMQTIQVIKYTMALNARETDPSSFMKQDSLKMYTLERGISICIYDLSAERQLPLESYIGFTLFKNGYPASYGGAWVFGRRAKFGMNIFEAYRGGESGYVMCQLLRVYKQEFDLHMIEIEPYQYGLDNPDGIKSGAFWFYYRYGFRPLENNIQKLAASEFKKIRKVSGYKSQEKTLIQFTESNMAIRFKSGEPLSVANITKHLISYVHKKHAGNVVKAEKHAIEEFCRALGIHADKMNETERNTLKDFAFWAISHHVSDIEKLKLLKQMLRLKTTNVYLYQKHLRTYTDPA